VAAMGMNSEISSYTISIYELLNQEQPFDLGLNEYPIFDENYRPILNAAITNYYMFREIGFSNPAIFRQKLKMRMDIIMRNKYNALYKAKQMEFNPLYTMELYETYSHSIDNTGESTNSGAGTSSLSGTSNQKNSEKNSNIDSTNVNSNNKMSTNNNNVESSKLSNDNITNTSSDSLGLTSNFPSEEMTENDLTSNLFVDSAQKQKGNETSNQNQKQTNLTSNSGDTQQNGSSSQKSDSVQSGNIEQNSDTTNSQTNTTSNSTNGTTKNNMSETYSKKTIGSASDLTFAHAMTQFKEYVDKFNLDQLVIDELKDLFMTVW
jgi:hypothetical protein